MMPFGIFTQVGPRNHVLDGFQISTCEGAILRAKRGRPRTCLEGGRGKWRETTGRREKYGASVDVI